MRVLLVPNTAYPQAVATVAETATWLAARGFEPVLDMADAAAIGMVDFGVERFDIDGVGLVITFGGDGTILKAVHILGAREVPILGINMGRLGFLTAAGPAETREAIVSALAGEVRIERRATVRVRVTTPQGTVEERGLNEVFVGRSDSARVVGLSLSIDGVRVARFRADGIIVATATGSTAYALSAGGPLVAPGFGGLVVVPVAPHTLAARALCTDPSDVIEIALDPLRSGACVTVDGTQVPCVAPIESIEITRGEADVLLAHPDDRGFYHAVADEFFGG